MPALPTLLEILNKTADYFKSRGIENYRLDAQLILSHVLKLKRIDLYLNFDRPLKESEVTLSRELVMRRGKREPLQHILGETPFRHLVLKTDKRALVPRKETELLVDLVLTLIDKQYKEKDPHLLEVGTGTGALTLALLHENPVINIKSIDVSEDCIQLAQENALKNEVASEGVFYVSDLFSALGSNEPFDIIFSNPPYVSEKEYLSLEPEVKDWDPKRALVGGELGTEFPKQLIEEALAQTKEGGYLMLEMGYSQSEELKQFGLTKGWKNAEIHRDYADIPRFLAFQK